jgi:hypothetical protein
MPVAKIHILEGQYDEARLGKVSRDVPSPGLEVFILPVGRSTGERRTSSPS